MMYPYITLPDETLITHSHLLDNEGEKEVEVHFERPTENGFDTVRFSLPSYRMIKKEGHYSVEEIQMFEMLLRSNAHLFFKYAKQGGASIA